MNNDIVEYTITIFTVDEPATATTGQASTTSFTAILELNATYTITLYASRCNHSLMSDPIITTIVVEGIASYMFENRIVIMKFLAPAGPSCLSPLPLPGVNISIITAGSVLSFQCEEGLVPEERLEAQCGPEGRWDPDPTLHNCTGTNSHAEQTTAWNIDTTNEGLKNSLLARDISYSVNLIIQEIFVILCKEKEFVFLLFSQLL